MQSMLPGAPWLLAHKSMLAANQPRKISLYGTDYVMWKDPAGTIHALPNACPHMGQCCRKDGAKPKAIAQAVSSARSMP